MVYLGKRATKTTKENYKNTKLNYPDYSRAKLRESIKQDKKIMAFIKNTPVRKLN